MRILNFGSLNIDRSYLVPHLVREGETISSHSLHVSNGGKGLNQSIALTRAGLNVFHAGKVGEDGSFLLEQLDENGVDISLVTSTDEVVTGHAIVQVDRQGQNCIILYGGANRAITETEADQVLAHFAPGDWIFLQNEISCVGHIISAAAARGMTVVLNPSPLDEELLQSDLWGVSWFILNQVEGEGLTGEQHPEHICAALRAKWPRAKVVLTLGGNGSLCDDGASLFRQDVFPTHVVDSTAAGDTFTGYFFAALCQGDSPAVALEWASMAASLAVGRRGAADSIPDRSEVEQALGTWRKDCEARQG